MPNMPIFAEYIWTDGTKPTARLRSKTKILRVSPGIRVNLTKFPDWNFDGSSTEQADADSSDCVLKPVFFCPDPVRGDGSYLVMCEVFESDGETPHKTNTRAKLREVLGIPGLAREPKRCGTRGEWIEPSPEESRTDEMLDCWFGLEQEYTLMRGDRPLGFPENGGFPAPQGPYYCGVGADEVVGRPLVEEHALACVEAGLKLSGVNAEVMPGQWEFQIGPAGPLEVGDHLWIARWLLYRIGEDHEISATLKAKPAEGDWNGAGCHANFSTPFMRSKSKEHAEDTLVTSLMHDWGPREIEAASGRLWGIKAIEEFCERAKGVREEHLKVYGDGYEQRLTGAHETASYKEVSWGVSNRKASFRIPLDTHKAGFGYLEDRRPNANIDPYEVATVMMKTAYNLW